MRQYSCIVANDTIITNFNLLRAHYVRHDLECKCRLITDMHFYKCFVLSILLPQKNTVSRSLHNNEIYYDSPNRNRLVYVPQRIILLTFITFCPSHGASLPLYILGFAYVFLIRQPIMVTHSPLISIIHAYSPTYMLGGMLAKMLCPSWTRPLQPFGLPHF